METLEHNRVSRAHNSPSISIPRNNVKSKTFGNSDAANLLPPNLEYLARLAFFCLLWATTSAKTNFARLLWGLRNDQEHTSTITPGRVGLEGPRQQLINEAWTGELLKDKSFSECCRLHRSYSWWRQDCWSTVRPSGLDILRASGTERYVLNVSRSILLSIARGLFNDISLEDVMLDMDDANVGQVIANHSIPAHEREPESTLHLPWLPVSSISW